MKKNVKKYIAYIVIGALCLALCLTMSISCLSSINDEYKILNVSEQSTDSITAQPDKRTLLGFDDAVVVSAYADAQDAKSEQSTATYYIIAFYDKDGTFNFASLSVKGSDEKAKKLNEMLLAYNNDDSQKFGDMIISACTMAYEEKNESTVKFYNSAVESYRNNSDFEINDTKLMLEYKCENEQASIDEYLDAQAATNRTAGIAYLCVSALELALIIFYIIKIKKQQRYDGKVI